jgi:hypothetical protein
LCHVDQRNICRQGVKGRTQAFASARL